MLNPDAALRDCRGHDTHHKGRCGGWIRGLQKTVNQYWPIIYDEEFKKNIDRHDNNIKPTQDKNAAVYSSQMFAFDPLNESKQGKKHTHQNRHKSQPIGDNIQLHMYTGKIVDELIGRSEAHNGFLRSDGRNIHAANCHRP